MVLRRLAVAPSLTRDACRRSVLCQAEVPRLVQLPTVLKPTPCATVSALNKHRDHLRPA